MKSKKTAYMNKALKTIRALENEAHMTFLDTEKQEYVKHHIMLILFSYNNAK
jgi:hypothetical protein